MGRHNDAGRGGLGRRWVPRNQGQRCREHPRRCNVELEERQREFCPPPSLPSSGWLQVRKCLEKSVQILEVLLEMTPSWSSVAAMALPVLTVTYWQGMTLHTGSDWVNPFCRDHPQCFSLPNSSSSSCEQSTRSTCNLQGGRPND